MLLYVALCLFVLLSSTKPESVSEGTVRFFKNGLPDESQAWSSGIVEIYHSSSWGNICNNGFFGPIEADVICHQFGYEGSSSYTNTGTTSVYGVDTAPTAIEEVSCGFVSSYLTVTQCSFTSKGSSSSCTDNNDVIITCYTTRIWDSPTTGDIRLTGGKYSNQGLLEVYCNDEWGTVCDDTFSNIEATVTCRQLGYNYFTNYNQLSNQGSSSEKIWLNSLTGCSASQTCLTNCQACPSTDVTICSHDEDVTLQCSYDSSKESSYGELLNFCDIADFSGWGTGIIMTFIGSALAVLICCLLIVTVPFCICCCLGVGIGAASNSRTTTTVCQHPQTGPTYQPLPQKDLVNPVYPPSYTVPPQNVQYTY